MKREISKKRNHSILDTQESQVLRDFFLHGDSAGDFFRLFADMTYDWETLRAQNGIYIYVTPSCQRITGYSPDDFYHNAGIMEKIIHPEWLERWIQHERSRDSDNEESIDFKIVTRSGEIRWIRHGCQTVQCKSPPMKFIRSSNTDVTTRKQLEEKLKFAAMRDPLTHLMNRRFFIESLKLHLAQAARQQKEFSLIIGDIDDFKKVNDEYGHECGDTVLKATADMMRQTLREQDLICRWGGEEFLILLPDTCYDSSLKVAEKLRNNVARHGINYNTLKIQITMSFGVSACHCTDSPDCCIRDADMKLLEAKRAGKNRVV